MTSGLTAVARPRRSSIASAIARWWAWRAVFEQRVVGDVLDEGVLERERRGVALPSRCIRPDSTRCSSSVVESRPVAGPDRPQEPERAPLCRPWRRAGRPRPPTPDGRGGPSAARGASTAPTGQRRTDRPQRPGGTSRSIWVSSSTNSGTPSVRSAIWRCTSTGSSRSPHSWATTRSTSGVSSRPNDSDTAPSGIVGPRQGMIAAMGDHGEQAVQAAAVRARRPSAPPSSGRTTGRPRTRATPAARRRARASRPVSTSRVRRRRASGPSGTCGRCAPVSISSSSAITSTAHRRAGGGSGDELTRFVPAASSTTAVVGRLSPGERPAEMTR